MEGSCLTGQSPQWAVVPMEEEEEEEEVVSTSEVHLQASSMKYTKVFFLIAIGLKQLAVLQLYTILCILYYWPR
jgi:hypothetical protein